MDKWELKPLESVGAIRFGMKRDEVHELFEEECTPFKKTRFSQNTTDDYGKFHVYYTLDNTVDAVEIFEGIELVLDRDVIFPVKTEEIERLLPGIEKDEGSYIHIGKSIGIGVDSTNAESILVGSKGYYE